MKLESGGLDDPLCSSVSMRLSWLLSLSGHLDLHGHTVAGAGARRVEGLSLPGPACSAVGEEGHVSHG